MAKLKINMNKTPDAIGLYTTVICGYLGACAPLWISLHTLDWLIFNGITLLWCIFVSGVILHWLSNDIKVLED